MRVSDIKVGHTYTDGKGRQRGVIGMHTNALSPCLDFTWVRYRETRMSGTRVRECTRVTFARWAKADVTVEVAHE